MLIIISYSPSTASVGEVRVSKAYAACRPEQRLPVARRHPLAQTQGSRGLEKVGRIKRMLRREQSVNAVKGIPCTNS
jgi:hypothetical protein